MERDGEAVCARASSFSQFGYGWRHANLLYLLYKY
jgi:hypothetical protein